MPCGVSGAWAVTQKDLKTFKLKARGDSGAGKTELLTAFMRMAAR